MHDLSDVKVKNAIEAKWYNSASLSDKLSNIAQAKHIDIKLKSLGFKKIKTNKNMKVLLEHNSSIFKNRLLNDLNSLNLDEHHLLKYSEELKKLYDNELKLSNPINIQYFPSVYDTLFEKLVRAEHNRWMAFYLLNGWIYSKNTIKPKKQHNCLISLDKFDTPELKLTIIYDIYAVLYIPNYLANTGYEITKMDFA